MKAEIRKEISEKRRNLDPAKAAEWDEQIFEKLKAYFDEKAWNVSFSDTFPSVYCYSAVRGETGTEKLIDWLPAQGIRVALPRVSGKEMSFYYVQSRRDLKPGCFGILEPDIFCEKAADMLAPVIVPGVAFSCDFHRIGYGAGYYDRFFAQEPEHEKIAICYEFQLLSRIPVKKHDIPVDRVITEQRILKRDF